MHAAGGLAARKDVIVTLGLGDGLKLLDDVSSLLFDLAPASLPYLGHLFYHCRKAWPAHAILQSTA